MPDYKECEKTSRLMKGQTKINLQICKFAGILLLVILFFGCSNRKEVNTTPKDKNLKAVTSIDLVYYKDTSSNIREDKNKDTISIRDKIEIEKLQNALQGEDITSKILKLGFVEILLIFHNENEKEIFRVSGQDFRSGERIFKSSQNLDSLCKDLIQKHKK